MKPLKWLKVDNTKDIVIKSWMYNHVVKAGKVWRKEMGNVR